jgi:hypothetical protein
MKVAHITYFRVHLLPNHPNPSLSQPRARIRPKIIYKLYFGAQLNQPEEKPVYFNPTRDTVFMEDDGTFSMFFSGSSLKDFTLDVAKVAQHLAIRDYLNVVAVDILGKYFSEL